jgi:hypothetical protein
MPCALPSGLMGRNSYVDDSNCLIIVSSLPFCYTEMSLSQDIYLYLYVKELFYGANAVRTRWM